MDPFGEHLEYPAGGHVLSCGHAVTWTEHERTLWLPAGGVALDGVSKEITGAVELPGGRFVLLASCKPLPVFGPSGAPVGALDRFQDGGLLHPSGVLITWGMGVFVWDAETLAPVHVIEGGHERWIQGARLLSDGRLLTWSMDKRLCIYDAVAGTLDLTLTGHRDQVDGAVELPDGRVASWSEDKAVKIWDPRPNKRRRSKMLKAKATLKGDQKYGRGAMALSGDRLLMLWRDGADVWSLESKERTARLSLPDKGVVPLPEGRAAFWGEGLEIWDVASDPPVKLSRPHDGWLGGAGLGPNGALLAWFSNATWVFEGGGSTELKGLHFATSGSRMLCKVLRSVGWTPLPAPAALAAPSAEAVVAGLLGDLPAGEGVVAAAGQSESPAPSTPAAQTSPPASYAGRIALADGRGLGWDKVGGLFAIDGDAVTRWTGHTKRVTRALQLTSGDVVTCAQDLTVRLWSLDGQEKGQFVLPKVARGVVELSDGRLATCALGDRSVFILDGQTCGGLDSFEAHKQALHGFGSMKPGRLVTWGIDSRQKLEKVVVVRDDVTLRTQLRAPADAQCGGTVLRFDARLLGASSRSLKKIWSGPGVGALASVPGRGCVQLPGDRVLVRGETLGVYDASGSLIADWGDGRGVQGGFTGPDGAVWLWGRTLERRDADTGVVIDTRDFTGTPTRLATRVVYVDGATVHDGDARVEMDMFAVGVTELSTGALAVWGGEEVKLLRAGQVVTLEHFESVNGVVELDGQIWTLADESIVRRWTLDGVLIDTFNGPLSTHGGMWPSADGMLFWSPDWDGDVGFWPGRSVGRRVWLSTQLGQIRGHRALSDGTLVLWGERTGWARVLSSTGDVLGGVFSGEEGALKDVMEVGGHLVSSDGSAVRWWSGYTPLVSLKSGGSV